jgi:hypothetical protein
MEYQPVHYFQADGAKLVTHKPHELRITVLSKDGNRQVYILPVKISETKIKRRSNQYRTMESVWPVPHEGPDHPQALDAAPLTDHLALQVENESHTARHGFLMWIQTKGGTSQGRTPQRYVLLRNHSRYAISSRDSTMEVVHIDLKSRNGDVSVLPRWTPAQYALLEPSDEFKEPVKVRKSKSKTSKSPKTKNAKSVKNKASKKKSVSPSAAATASGASAKTTGINNTIPNTASPNVLSLNTPPLDTNQYLVSGSDSHPAANQNNRNSSSSAVPLTDPLSFYMKEYDTITTTTPTTPTTPINSNNNNNHNNHHNNNTIDLLTSTTANPAASTPPRRGNSIVPTTPGQPLKLNHLQPSRLDWVNGGHHAIQPPSSLSRSSSLKRRRDTLRDSYKFDTVGEDHSRYHSEFDFNASSKRFRSNSMPLHMHPYHDYELPFYLQMGNTFTNNDTSSAYSSSIKRSMSYGGESVPHPPLYQNNLLGRSESYGSYHSNTTGGSSVNTYASSGTHSIDSIDNHSDDDSNSSLGDRSSRVLTPVPPMPTPEYVHEQLEIDVPSPPSQVRPAVSSLSPLSIQDALPRVPDDNVMAADLFNEGTSFFHPLSLAPVESVNHFPSILGLNQEKSFPAINGNDNYTATATSGKEKEKEMHQPTQLCVDDPFFDLLMPISSVSSHVSVV